MLAWVENIEKVTLTNTNFRTVVHTGKHSQLTVMSIPPGGEVGWEAHGHLDQFLRLEQGKARLDFGKSQDQVDQSYQVENDWATGRRNQGSWRTRLAGPGLHQPPGHPPGGM